MEINSYRDLRVWQDGTELAQTAYHLTRVFPKEARSLKELETHIILAERVGLAKLDAIGAVLDQCERIGKMLRSLIRSLEDQTRA